MLTTAPPLCSTYIQGALNTHIHIHNSAVFHTHTHTRTHTHTHTHTHTMLIHSILSSRHSAYPVIRLNPSICIAGLCESLIGHSVCVCVCVCVCAREVLQCVTDSSTLSLLHTPLCSSHDPFNFL